MKHPNRHFAYVLACIDEVQQAIVSKLEGGDPDIDAPLTPMQALEMIESAIENYECPFDQIDDDYCHGRPLPELAALLRDLKVELDYQGAQKTVIQKKYDFLSIAVIPDLMDEQGVETMKIAGVGRLQVSSDINCSVPAPNKEAVQKWLRDNGHDALVQETINSSTFKAFIKERMREEKDYPKDLIKVNPFSRATVVKG